MKKMILLSIALLFLTIGFTQNNKLYKIKKSKGKFGVINKKSKEIIIPFIYDNILDFDGNYATIKYLLKTEIINFDAPCKSSILEYYEIRKVNINNKMKVFSKLLVIINPKNRFSRIHTVTRYSSRTISQSEVQRNYYSKQKRRAEIDKCLFEKEKHIGKITKQYSKLGWKIEFQNEK